MPASMKAKYINRTQKWKDLEAKAQAIISRTEFRKELFPALNGPISQISADDSEQTKVKVS